MPGLFVTLSLSYLQPCACSLSCPCTCFLSHAISLLSILFPVPSCSSINSFWCALSLACTCFLLHAHAPFLTCSSTSFPLHHFLCTLILSHSALLTCFSSPPFCHDLHISQALIFSHALALFCNLLFCVHLPFLMLPHSIFISQHFFPVWASLHVLPPHWALSQSPSLCPLLSYPFHTLITFLSFFMAPHLPRPQPSPSSQPSPHTFHTGTLLCFFMLSTLNLILFSARSSVMSH